MPVVRAGDLVERYWVEIFRKEVSAELDKAADVIVSAFKKCMTEVQDTPEKCLEKAMADAGLAKTYAGIYAKARPALKFETGVKWHTFLAALGDTLKAQVKGLVADAYSECMKKKGVAADCYKKAAEEKKLGKELAAAWEATTVEIPE